MRPARFERATSASAGQASGCPLLARDGGTWPYMPSCGTLDHERGSSLDTGFWVDGHILDILLPFSLTTSRAKP
jgi:hypothetical protein